MKNKKECISCKNIIDINANRCPLCNTKQTGGNLVVVSQNSSSSTEAYKYCFSCGEKIKSAAEMCPHCGVMQYSNNTITQEVKSRSTAALFAIFLGIFGVHKFYLGKIGAGIVYIVISFTYISFILALIDSMIIAYSSEATFNRMYNADNQYVVTPCSGGIKVLVTIIFLFFVSTLLVLIFWIIIAISSGFEESFSIISSYIDDLIYNIF